MSERRHGMSLKLPQEVAASEDSLQAAAARVLCLAHVRSVTIDYERTSVMVRLQARRDSGADDVSRSRDVIENSLGASGDVAAQAVDVVSWTEPRDGSISFIRMPKRVQGWRKVVYLALAGAALLLGFLGIVLPGLPTTPFVLLGSYFLVRSSTHLHDRLMASRVFGGVLRDWYVHRGLRPHVRARAIAVVAIVVVLSFIVARPPWPAAIIIGALAACGLIVIWRLPTVRTDEAFRADK